MIKTTNTTRAEFSLMANADLAKVGAGGTALQANKSVSKYRKAAKHG
jgi:hypothetical protein